MATRLVSRDGKSAYQAWLDAGNTGTEATFLLSLKGSNGTNGTNGSNGAPGAIGATGPAGSTGPAGTTGAPGAPGAPGAAGASGRLATRSTGGSAGQLCYRKDDGTLAALTPALDTEFDRELVMIGSDNLAYVAGQAAPVTGLTPFVLGRDMYVITPSPTTAPNLAATDAAGAYPTSAEPNSTQRLLIAGRTTAGPVFTLNPRAYVARSSGAPPVTYLYLDATDFTLNTNAVGNGLTYAFNNSGQAQFADTKRTDADAAGGTGFMASTIVEASNGISLQHKSFGGLHILRPTTWDQQADGQWLYQFQAGNGSGAGTMDIQMPGLVFRMTGGLSAAGRALAVRIKSTGVILQDITLNADNTFVATTVGTATTASIASNTIYNMRVDVRGTALKVRIWAASATEPTTWLIDRTDLPYSTAGYAGMCMQQDWHRQYRFSRAIGTAGTAPLTRP